MMVFLSLVTLLIVTEPFANGAVIMRENDAKAFLESLKFWKSDIDHECYEEGCEFGEVVDQYGHTEQSYEYWNKYQCEKFNIDCDVVDCRGSALGMENGDIPGSSITASSWYKPYISYRPDAGRLNKDNETWCPNRDDKEPYLQVEFSQKQEICAVATQGSALYDTDFVSDYAIETSEDGNKWNVYENNGSAQIMPGNTNNDDMVKNNLENPVAAFFIRIAPKSWNSWPCMRVEVYGKPAPVCEVKTTDDKCCVFPFIYDGEKRYTCISKGHWRKWCATTGNYDENDDDWGNCAEPEE